MHKLISQPITFFKDTRDQVADAAETLTPTAASIARTNVHGFQPYEDLSDVMEAIKPPAYLLQNFAYDVALALLDITIGLLSVFKALKLIVTADIWGFFDTLGDILKSVYNLAVDVIDAAVVCLMAVSIVPMTILGVVGRGLTTVVEAVTPQCDEFNEINEIRWTPGYY